MTTTYKTQEVRDFLINYYDGIIVPFSLEHAEQLLSRDTTVYAEFKALKRKKQKVLANAPGIVIESRHLLRRQRAIQRNFLQEFPYRH